MSSPAPSAAQPPAAPPSAAATPAPPAWLTVAWRGGVFLALMACGTVASLALRGTIGGFGWELLPLVLCVAGTLVLVLPVVVVLAPFMDFPEDLYGNFIPEQRERRGRCGACGYQRHAGPEAPCAECGAMRPQAYARRNLFTARSLRRAAMLSLSGALAGCAVGLAVSMLDERSFVVETENEQARTPGMAYRERMRRPLRMGSLRWTITEGFTGPGIPEAQKVRGWKPAPPAASSTSRAADTWPRTPA